MLALNKFVIEQLSGARALRYACVESSGTKPKKRTVSLCFTGTEYEYEVIRKNGDSTSFGGVSCDSIEDVEISIYDKVIDNKRNTNRDCEINRSPAKCINLSDDVVCVRRLENKSSYSCNIEVEKKFDPKKLVINLGCTELVVGDDTITTEVAISSITYDDIEYDVEYDGSENCSIEVIWGSEPEL